MLKTAVVCQLLNPPDHGTLIAFADAIELMFVGIGLIALPIMVYLYKRINAKREREMGRVRYTEELKEIEFRYTM